MHKDLTLAFNKMIDILKTDERCFGGWHFGSVARNMTDEYSDYDPVFLIDSKGFESFANDIPKLMADISDELLICWAEDFNNNCFKNFCCAIRIGANIHQLDVFMVNNDEQEDWMCKMHLSGCTEDNIIFDRTGETALLLNKGCSVENHVPDTMRAVDTYWFHAVMLVKYFRRGDVFKVLKNIGILFHAHADLLLSKYDTMSWGDRESKVKHCVPVGKQEHLKVYFASADLTALKSAVRKGMKLFESDAAEICKSKGVDCPKLMPGQVIAYFNRSTK